MKLRQHPSQLDHDPSRVVARFSLPGDGVVSAQSRAAQIVARVLAMSTEVIRRTAAEVLADLSASHPHAAVLLSANAHAVSTRLHPAKQLTAEQEIVLGAAFTAERAVEGAALCNPSAVAHPSQHGLAPGELRVAISLRGIGEGHISSIEFADAVIGAEGSWTFGARSAQTFPAVIGSGEWGRDHFAHTLEDAGTVTDVSSSVLAELPSRFTIGQLEEALLDVPVQLSFPPDSHSAMQSMRDVAASAYRATFPADSPLSGRVLSPVSAAESNGMEDARFVVFTHPDGTTEYRATYTAYDGHHIGARLITSSDLMRFDVHRLTGAGALNKGMALFPRLVGGKHLALSRTDGETISLARSDDGLVWEDGGVVRRPQEMWEVVQLGNCGSPIETADGWLVLTHGVGPLRTYSLGAMLLDRDDPSRVITRTREPLLEPGGDLREGYVPRVVYSCGPIAHNGILWIPLGVGDSRIRVYSIAISDLVGSMTA